MLLYKLNALREPQLEMLQGRNPSPARSVTRAAVRLDEQAPSG